MGKIRVNTIGDESIEKKQKQKAEKRKEIKAQTKGEDLSEKKDDNVILGTSETRTPESSLRQAQEETDSGQVLRQAQDVARMTTNQTAVKAKQKKQVSSKKPRSAKYKEAKALIEKDKMYPISQALDLVEKTHLAKFDETVELHINTTESGISGTMTLPHGTGKKTRVVVLSPSKDPKGTEEIIKEIESGKISFDVLIATPDAMPKLAKVARILGPKGLMPNPKNGTITAKPEELAKKYEGGQISFKTEAKSPIMHLVVGKLSFGKDKLSENINEALRAVQSKNIRNVTIKSTMSPGIPLAI